MHCCGAAGAAAGAGVNQPARWRPRISPSRRPKAPFDLTGTWLHGGGADNPFRFAPPAGFKLTPAAQVHYDAARKAQAEGQGLSRRHRPVLAGGPAGHHDARLADRDDAVPDRDLHGQRVHEQPAHRLHWTAGRIPIRTSSCPASTASRSGAGKATRWSSTRKHFAGHHHWIDSGIPASDALHIVERIKLLTDGNTLQIEYELTDPKSWEGTWKYTKRWRRVEDRDIAEVSCLPDLNEHMPTTKSGANVRYMSARVPVCQGCLEC